MQRVEALGPSLINAGLVGSHPVYPRASKVGRNPPEGKLEASGSPWINPAPENSKRTPPSPSGARNESCFSAVKPVKGWNQCVKCVAPLEIAQVFMASATSSAMVGSSFPPSLMVLLKEP